jgi:hypothetical protein
MPRTDPPSRTPATSSPENRWLADPLREFAQQLRGHQYGDQKEKELRHRHDRALGRSRYCE